MSILAKIFSPLPKNIHIFILDDNEVFLEIVHKYLETEIGKRKPDKNLIFQKFSSPQGDFIKQVEETKPQILVLDYYLDLADKKQVLGSTVLKEVQKVSPDTDVLILTGEDKLETALTLMKAGAYDFIVKSETANVNVMKSILRIIAKNDSEFSSARNRIQVWMLAIFWILTISAGILVKLFVK